MSTYPPYPLVTFVGFLVHAVVFSAMSVHFLKKRKTTSFFYLGLATGVDAINFLLIVIAFYFFPNNDAKTMAFFLNAFLWKPFVSVFAIMALIAVKEKWAHFAWAFFAVALVVVAILFADVLGEFRATQPMYAFVHPVYPEIAALNESSGMVGALAFCFFFLYHAFSQSLFVRRRSLFLAAAAAAWSFSALYWTTTDIQTYLVTLVVGIVGSILAAIGVFAFHKSKVTTREMTENL